MVKFGVNIVHTGLEKCLKTICVLISAYIEGIFEKVLKKGLILKKKTLKTSDSYTKDSHHQLKKKLKIFLFKGKLCQKISFTHIQLYECLLK
jgi:hypothetical protein